MTEIDIGLPERQQIEQQVDGGLRIARHMPAIGKDLPIDFAIEFTRRAPNCRGPRFHRDRGHGKGNA
ncbi:hypothetical protein D3C87_2128240 [compost metagenome]